MEWRWGPDALNHAMPRLLYIKQRCIARSQEINIVHLIGENPWLRVSICLMNCARRNFESGNSTTLPRGTLYSTDFGFRDKRSPSGELPLNWAFIG